MARIPAPEKLADGLYRFVESCNVYVLVRRRRAIAIDFGEGNWLDALGDLGVERIDHIYLTHHHADQCHGLRRRRPAEALVHAPAGDEAFLDPERQAQGTFDPREKGCPDSYATLPGGLADLRFDLAGFTDQTWSGTRVRFLHTPGHGRHAVSVVADIGRRQAIFCGDAVHPGATIHQPWHLEWDHWTGEGALAAWEGIERLRGVGCDLLCPSHGAVIDRKLPATLRALSRRLLAFYDVKGQIAPRERDRYVAAESVAPGCWRLSPSLYAFGGNGYLLVSSSGDAFVVDPYAADMPALERLLTLLPGVRPAVATATHCHCDHSDALAWVRTRYGATVALHPQVAAPLALDSALVAPWLPSDPVVADELWPRRGAWRWREYLFSVAPAPGQTRWHAVFQARIDDQAVAFIGDTFQPPTRWNGTGGFCAYNGCRFRSFARSARDLRRARPDLLVAGHGTWRRFSSGYFAQVERWAARAAVATKALCPSGDLRNDYYRIAALAARDDAMAGRLFWKGA